MNTSLSLSFELIYLMGWLLRNEKKMINELVDHAIKNGFGNDIEQLSTTDFNQISEQLDSTILDFLLYLEEALDKKLDTIQLDKKAEDIVIPAIKKLDQDSFDINTIKLSMRQTKSQLNLHKKKRVDQDDTTATNQKNGDVAKILFERILKNWKPTKNEPMH